MPQTFIPDLSAVTGAALTIQEWLDLGVDTAVYTLSSLLMKPGYAVLMQSKGLRAWGGWPNVLLLNVSDLMTAQGAMPKNIQIRSIYDGQIMTFTASCLMALMTHLNPDEQLSDRLIFQKRCDQTPIKDAMAGIVYDRSNRVLITDQVHALSFEPLSQTCDCPVCHRQFTRAYFHHLYQHTPLLCYRYLIQHNVFMRKRDSWLMSRKISVNINNGFQHMGY